MSERKVLNKYYPPEFDPSKIPKLKQPKNRTFSIRIMAPFNMRCNTCGEYIYKGKKFNSRKENVDNEDYLGLRIFRFYIKCPRCVAEIAFKTDLANTDYALEAGATRLFEAEKLAQQMAEKERKEKEEDELNPMKMLENRTKASRNEMEQLDQLEELREMNARHASIDYEKMMSQHMAYEEQLLKLQEEEEDKLVQEILRKGHSSTTVRRLKDDDSDEEKQTEAKKPRQEAMISVKATDILCDNEPMLEDKKKENVQKNVGKFSSKTALMGLVKRKVASSALTPSSSSANSTPAANCTFHETLTIKPEANLIGSGPQNITVQEASVCLSPQVESKPSISLGLGLLGDYSSSNDESE